MQQAADLGVALAQYQLGSYYGNSLKQLEQEHALMDCAAAQNLSAALYNRAIYNKIHQRAPEALNFYQRTVMAGGPKGADAAYILFDAFTENSPSQRDLQTLTDTKREQAYIELQTALAGGAGKDGNTFLRFPRLNEVLPLPPAKIPPWKGIYSAMSPDDAKYYRNPPSPQTYINDIRRSGGYLVSDDYLSKPVLGAD
jgi:TPR repeat protein